jgi:uncharacterized repeat protein (TIGR03847 family)
MAEKRDFGALAVILAEAIGQPGQRRFRLRAVSLAGDTASLWIEKEQLAALADAIETVLANEGYQYARTPLDDREEPPVLPLSADVDFRVGQLSMGVDQQRQRLVIVAGDAGGDEGVAITMELDFRRGYELRHQVADVVAAGRPPCPLCSGPMDPVGHVCPRTNGHHELER